MLQSTLDSANITLSALREQYHNYSLTIRNIQAESVKRQFTYTNRLFDYFGPPQTAAELFSQLDQTTLSEFLVHYTKRYTGSGSRRSSISWHTTCLN